MAKVALAADEWAVEEFGAAVLGDARRTARLVDLASTWAVRPTASFPDAARDAAQLEAAYRFVENDAVAPAALLAAHTAQTQRRCAAVPVVLAAQDTTELDYTSHPRTTGLGMLGDRAHQGLLLHTTLALTPDRLPLGLLALDDWTRDPAEAGKTTTRRQRPPVAKESAKWGRSLAVVTAAAAVCPTTHFVSVGDREADVYDLFTQARAPTVDLLVRAAQNRRVAGAADRRAEADEAAAADGEAAGEGAATTRTLRAAVAAVPVGARVQIAVPARGATPARVAAVAVRWATVTLCPPLWRTRRGETLPAVTLGAVWATEETPPPDTAPLDWLLLTTVPVATTADALQVLEWYACRWGIEVWHRVLKQGCRIEARQLEDVAPLRRALVVYAVIAWRLLYTTLLARVLPDAPCTLVLTATEWQALWCTIHRAPTPPSAPPPLRQAVRWIAVLGGFIDRPQQGEPGVTVLWKGWQHLADLTRMYAILAPPPKDVTND